jgi:hypothetical protein
MARGDKDENPIRRGETAEFKEWVKWFPDVNVCVLFYHGSQWMYTPHVSL